MTEPGPPTYRQPLIEGMWRITSLLDRNCYSKTQGSFSRTHWAWKFEDFPFPRMQEAVYALVRLYDLPGADNPFYQSPAVRDWVRHGFDYWCGRQHADGGFDEAYPNEQCLAATGFTGFYLAEAYRRAKSWLPVELCVRLESAFAAAAQWLCDHDETHAVISNHLAVAAAALELAAGICGQTKFSQRAKEFVDRILAHQSEEGWFLEYDGADIGYGTHGYFYLAVYWRETGCLRTLAALDKAAEFYAYFVHPDGTIGGEYASRNTEFYYPAGFEMMARFSTAAATIAVRQRKAIAERRVCGVWSMDAFNLLPMYNNLFFALDVAEEIEADLLPWQRPSFRRYFADAGIWVCNESRFYAVIGLGKGGTVSVFDKATRCLTARYAGYICHHDGRTFTSQDYVRQPTVTWSADSTEVQLIVPWKCLKIPVFSSWLFLAFRLFTLTVGKYPVVSRRVKQALVDVLIRRKLRPSIVHERRVRITPAGVELEDTLQLPEDVHELQAVPQFISVHMGSSMYCDARTPAVSAEPVRLAVGSQATLRAVLGVDGADWNQQGGRTCVASAA